jgi:hypothetical protein
MAGVTKNTTNRTQHLDKSPLSIWAINPPKACYPATCPAKLQRPVPTEGPSRVKPHLNKRTQNVGQASPLGCHSARPEGTSLIYRFVKTKPNLCHLCQSVVPVFVQNKPKYPRFQSKNEFCRKKQTQSYSWLWSLVSGQFMQNKPNFY